MKIDVLFFIFNSTMSEMPEKQYMRYLYWNQIYTLINVWGPDNPHLPWDIISANANITENIVAAHLDWPWDYHNGLSKNINISWKFIKAHPDKDWCYSTIAAENPHITLDDIFANDMKFDQNDNIYKFIDNPNMTLDLYDNNKLFRMGDDDKRWYYQIFRNNSISFVKLLEGMAEFYADVMRKFRKFGNIIAEVYRAFPSKYVNLADVLYNEKMALIYISELLLEKSITRDHHHRFIVDADKDVFNQKIAVAVVANKLQFDDWLTTIGIIRYAMSSNPHIEYDKIKDELYKWDVCRLVHNIALNMDEVIDILQSNPGEHEHYMQFVAMHPFMTIEYIDMYDELPWDDYIKRIARRITAVFSTCKKHYDDSDSDDEHSHEQQTKLNIYYSPFISWKDIMNVVAEFKEYDYHYAFANKYKMDDIIHYKILMRKYYHRWVSKTVIKRNKVIYSCCVHELNMRFRDAEKMTMYATRGIR